VGRDCDEERRGGSRSRQGRWHETVRCAQRWTGQRTQELLCTAGCLLRSRLRAPLDLRWSLLRTCQGAQPEIFSRQRSAVAVFGATLAPQPHLPSRHGTPSRRPYAQAFADMHRVHQGRPFLFRVCREAPYGVRCLDVAECLLTHSLQRFADRIANHPTLQRSQLVADFLQSHQWVRSA
jgi:hypothetical protein